MRKFTASAVTLTMALSVLLFALTWVSEAATTIRFFHYIRGRERNVIEDMINRFEQENPDIKVQFEFVPETDHMVKMQTMIAAGDIPDVIGLKDVMLPDFVRFGVLEPLDRFVESNASTINTNDWVPGLNRTLRIGGHLYGVPEQWSPNVLYVHKGLLDQAGVAVPTVGYTWEDLRAYGKKLTKDTNGDGRTDVFGFGGISGRIDNIAAPIWNYGGDVLDTESMEYQLTSDAVRQVYQLRVDMMHVDKIVPRPDQRQGVDHWEIERMAMHWDNRYIMPRFQTFDWAEEHMRAAPHPVGPKGDRNRASMRILTVPRGARHLDEALKLIDFLAGPEGVRDYVKLGRVSPWYKSILYSQEHGELLNSFEDPMAYVYGADTWAGGFLPVQWEKVRKLTQDWAEAMLRQTVSVEEGTERLNRELTQLYQELPPEERIYGGVPEAEL